MSRTAPTSAACGFALERLSDLLEGALAEPLHSEVQAHVESCSECGALAEAMKEVSALLRAEAPEPAADLAARVATASWHASRPAPLALPAPAFLGGWLASAFEERVKTAWANRADLARLMPLPVAVALAVILLSTAFSMVPRSSLPPSARRLLARGETAREMLVEQKERLMEDVDALRLVVGSAFSGRVEQMQDQLEDYRRMVGRSKDAPRKKGSSRALENFARPGAVAVSERPDAAARGRAVPGRSLQT